LNVGQRYHRLGQESAAFVDALICAAARRGAGGWSLTCVAAVLERRGEMKALTLWQPWASLVATGDKGFETRSWQTKYRGKLAIHASVNFPKWAKELCGEQVFAEALFGPGINKYHSSLHLPLGAIVTICNLVDCIPITEQFAASLTEQERAFGDYRLGRFAWELKDVIILPAFIPAKGRQGLWNWEPPEGV